MVRIETLADGAIRRVTLDRPERRNALRPPELDELERAVTDAPEPVVYLTGDGPAFCAGADLDTVAQLDDPAAFAGHGQRVARAIETADSVVVAGIDGPARGGGVELALACDLRVATPQATFSESGITLGLFGAWGGTDRLPRAVGPANARDMMLSGRVVDAEEARRMGLVSRIVADPESVAREIAENPPDALGKVKQLLGDATDRSDDTAYEPSDGERAEREAFAELHAAHADEIAAGRE
jgi:enoyl-CoA hydratase/carnithine racemase